MSYVLLIYIYAGVWAKGDSVAIQTIQYFPSMQSCIEAGQKSEELVKGTAKDLRFKCYEVNK
jgi:hypothetical protein